MKKIRCILIEPKNGIHVIKLDYNDYKDILRKLKCDYIACVPREIAGYMVDVYCDEDYLLKQLREPSIVTRDKKTRQIIEVLYGNCLIASRTKHGNIKGLTKKMAYDIMLTQASITTALATYKVLRAEM